ncbi:MAG: hypothetical protein OHM56_05670 [Spiroplasma phoeniceum]|nr:MAG: hypothetical protein OHM57_05075 [Spiroplasma phoeniceum]UZQ33410.1 MAG: hypothetical protein OHM56_05670 [Spiroplasma phoeniceum]
MFLRLKEELILWLISNILQFAMFAGVNIIGANYPITINRLLAILDYLCLKSN